MSDCNSTETVRLCEFPGCGRKYSAKGLCKGHYYQRLHGRESRLLSMMRSPNSPPRIMCDESPCQNSFLSGPCHVYRGSKDTCGYGSVCISGRMMSVHRYVWSQEFGPIPPGMMIDHMCRNRACCNTDHLRLVTPKQNSTENIVRIQKTHCPQGHPYDQTNTYRHGSRRHCRKCRKEQQNKYSAKRKATVNQ